MTNKHLIGFKEAKQFFDAPQNNTKSNDNDCKNSDKIVRHHINLRRAHKLLQNSFDLTTNNMQLRYWVRQIKWKNIL